MGGRIYDPLLGRFLSVDPLIQDLGSSQSLNAYSYVLNNPFGATDPTGYGCVAIGDDPTHMRCHDAETGETAVVPIPTITTTILRERAGRAP